MFDFIFPKEGEDDGNGFERLKLGPVIQAERYLPHRFLQCKEMLLKITENTQAYNMLDIPGQACFFENSSLKGPK